MLSRRRLAAPWTAIRPRQDLFEINPPVQSLNGKAKRAALASARMNWSVPDAVPTEKLNRIVWGHIKGWETPYPAPKRALFAPLSIDSDDDEAEEQR